jgi:hypothetical protein
MRLKEDSNSWKANSILKRDFKHDHSDTIMLFKSHKNTNKWFRGKVGVEHIILWHKHKWTFGGEMYLGKCSNCGKKFYKDSEPIETKLTKINKRPSAV